jgi:hypothetical protein
MIAKRNPRIWTIQICSKCENRQLITETELVGVRALSFLHFSRASDDWDIMLFLPVMTIWDQQFPEGHHNRWHFAFYRSRGAVINVLKSRVVMTLAIPDQTFDCSMTSTFRILALSSRVWSKNWCTTPPCRSAMGYQPAIVVRHPIYDFSANMSWSHFLMCVMFFGVQVCTVIILNSRFRCNNSKWSDIVFCARIWISRLFLSLHGSMDKLSCVSKPCGSVPLGLISRMTILKIT